MYKKPVVLADESISEGVFLASGDAVNVDDGNVMAGAETDPGTVAEVAQHLSVSYKTCEDCKGRLKVECIKINHLLKDDNSSSQEVTYTFDKPVSVVSTDCQNKNYVVSGNSVIITYSEQLKGIDTDPAGCFKVTSSDGITPRLLTVSAREL